MNKKIIPVIICLLIAIISAAPAMATDYDNLVSGGKALLNKENHAEAESTLREALKLDPEGRDALLYLGIALSRQGKSKEAESLLKRALLKDPGNALANLELGKLYQAKDILSEASDFYENVLSLAPRTQYAREAENLLKSLTGKAPKRWAIGISTGLQYDSNVILAPDDWSPSGGVSGKSDWRAVASLAGSIQAYEKGAFKSMLGYSFYQDFYTDLSEYSVQAHSIKALASYDIGDKMRLAGTYSFDYILLDSGYYSGTHSFTPSLLYAFGKGRYSTVSYRFGSNDYDDSARTGESHVIGLSHQEAIGESFAVRADIAYDGTSAEDDSQAYSGYKTGLSFTFMLPYDISSQLYGEYFYKDYDDARRDEMQSYSVSFSRDFLPWLGVSLSNLTVLNDSNTSAYRYDRNVTSTILTARF